ncbi:GNAT family N-acetyltransferase [Staphylococcus kloosii]|jgi:RimJ/RimL family protein N-acetyltransferase|uniref:N-acetyltransferase n=1 Tax=Staphylococcus kloosii TaxID=29384 RepID=A0ABQ0XNJ9_9STAP|nr:GNAT family protein [Staphylococcus kloosii]AVQ34668.1 GNAT family N-acetyltransferase [Staphylococcus kloosii]MBF7023025.1 GNAT family N-acetyltransferase [Staphylococcus kloosii]PNZ04360.1 GNAT family N-acetyltransferase [Staphylococcus kloosii]PTJ74817.1 GNAT family N-acetyltransferase [Staphylococcus kloosii]SUM50220.1 acetyltransferase [Staphylococcus kloosii]
MELIEYSEPFYKQLEDYQLSEAQLQFTGFPLENIHKQQDNHNHPILLLNDKNEVVTYFGLQEDHEYCEYFPNHQTCLMRSYSTDLRHLRKGYGKASLALLPDFMHHNYPDIETIILAVNERNQAAQKLYKNGGFVDSGRRVAGKKGTLIIMELTL